MMSFEERVALYGTAECVNCGEAFTAANPCANDSGNNGELHIDGECDRCAQAREQSQNLRRWRRGLEITNNDL